MAKATVKLAPSAQVCVNPVELLREAAADIHKKAGLSAGQTGDKLMVRAINSFNAMTGHNLSEREGYVFMSLLKMAKTQVAEDNAEEAAQADYISTAAYVALAGEAA